MKVSKSSVFLKEAVNAVRGFVAIALHVTNYVCTSDHWAEYSMAGSRLGYRVVPYISFLEAEGNADPFCFF
jgi:hypothetical protein